MAVNIFFSYTHKDPRHSDEQYVNDVISILRPLEQSGRISILWDRVVKAGESRFASIDEMLNNSDIILLFVSANYLSSESCQDEIKKSSELRYSRGAIVVPIIVSPCPWEDNDFLHSLLALPEDGKPISLYSDSNSANMDIYRGVKKRIEDVEMIQTLKIRNEFLEKISDTQFLRNAHPRKKDIKLEDIFVFPNLREIDTQCNYGAKNSKKDIQNSESLIDDYKLGSNMIISGSGQSGKTSLLKIFFQKLRNKGFLPIYIADKSLYFQGSLKKRMQTAFLEQYETSQDIDSFEKDKIVLLVDDFHFARQKDELLEEVLAYKSKIFIVDDVFSINLKDSTKVSGFRRFVIQEYSPSQRDALIRKWISLSDAPSSSDFDYQELDEKTAVVDSVLGKMLGNGIMPSLPFFILSVVSTYDSTQKPLDQEITSQGYCYQALLIYYLSKEKVRSEDIDTYLNFLSQFAYYLYKNKKQEITKLEFDDFFKYYCSEYTFSLKKEDFINHLKNAQILRLSSLGMYSFSYKYLYFFFAGKFFAEEADEEFKNEIDEITNHLYLDDYAYIAVFIAHHTKKGLLPQKLKEVSKNLFSKFTPAKLDKQTISFFDKRASEILPATFNEDNSCEEQRKEALSQKDITEENPIESDDNNPLEEDLRKAYKTVEVIGQIIRNRTGSIKTSEIEELYHLGMDVLLRVLDSFLNLIKDEKNQEIIESFILEQVKKYEEQNGSEKEKKNLSEIQKKNLAKKIFWNLNFFVILGILEKIRLSLGSSKLDKVIVKVCDSINSPASQIIKYSNLMWYNKVLNINGIKNLLDDKDFSQVAKNVMNYFVFKYAEFHPLKHDDAARITALFDVSQRTIQKGLLKYKRPE